MHKLYSIILLIIFSISGVIFINVDAHAISNSIVISQVQTENSNSASNELIEIYNNSSSPVEISDWCLYYASATTTNNGSKLACFDSSNDSIHMFLPANSYALAISTSLALTNPQLAGDITFSAKLAGAAGHIRLLDSSNNEIDKIGWGLTAVSAEGQAAVKASENHLLERLFMNASSYQDSDNNNVDFVISLPRVSYSYGHIYEIQDLCSNILGIQQLPPIDYVVDDNICNPIPVDICNNLVGLQTILPVDYLFDDEGNCQLDACVNITGLQVNKPDNMDTDEIGNCYYHDECSNFPSVQAILPNGFDRLQNGVCVVKDSHIIITEILPNVSGDDNGNEFIEIYNPNDFDIDLNYYRLKLGKDLEKSYDFPINSIIPANNYIIFNNNQILFTLLNTSSRAGIALVDDSIIDQTETYSDPPEDSSWALIDGVWQYTTSSTAGTANLLRYDINLRSTKSSTVNLVPCGINQYRSEETNRCRNISSPSSNSLTPCKDNQYRSEETNRCRLLTSGSLLKACNDDQFRNPETGRCKKIASAEELSMADCGEGRERNLTSGRCRNIVAIPSSEAAFAVEPIKDSAKVFIGWWALGGITIIALAYAGWEWRFEIRSLIQKILTVFVSK